MVGLSKRQETLLAILGQERAPIYTSTREAVHTLKHPIRGIDKRQFIMMDTWHIKGSWTDRHGMV
jgi:hypothetical protein